MKLHHALLTAILCCATAFGMEKDPFATHFGSKPQNYYTLSWGDSEGTQKIKYICGYCEGPVTNKWCHKDPSAYFKQSIKSVDKILEDFKKQSVGYTGPDLTKILPFLNNPLPEEKDPLPDMSHVFKDLLFKDLPLNLDLLPPPVNLHLAFPPIAPLNLGDLFNEEEPQLAVPGAVVVPGGGAQNWNPPPLVPNNNESDDEEDNQSQSSDESLDSDVE